MSPDRSRNPLEGVGREGGVSPSRRHAGLDVLDVLDAAGRSGDCLHFSLLPSPCHAAGAWLPAYPPPPRAWWAVEAMRKEQTLEPPRNTFHDNPPTRHAAKTVDRLLSPLLFFTAA